MRPSKPRNKLDHILEQDVLKSAIFFGGNGSGKSNIIKALRFLKKMVTTDWIPEPKDGYYCKYCPDNKYKPIRFKIEFLKKHDSDDFSDIIDWQLNRTWNAPRDVQRFNQDEDYVHYVYEVELQYVSDGLPYNISLETCSIVNHNRVVEYVNKKNKLSSKNIEEISSSKAPSVLQFEFNSRIDEIRSQISEYEREKSVLIKKLSEIDNKTSSIKAIQSNMIRTYYDNLDVISHNNVIGDDEKAAIKKQYDLLITYKKKKFDDLSKIDDKIYSAKKILDDEIEKLLKIEKDIAKNKKIREQIKVHLEVSRHSMSLNRTYSEPSLWMESVVKSDIHDWFVNTLVLVDIREQVFPFNGFEHLNKVDMLLPNFDAHINGLTSVAVTDMEFVSRLIDRLDEIELKKFINYVRLNEGLGSSFSKIVTDDDDYYEFKYSNSKLSIRKLMTVHKDGTVHELYEESDGTRRLIELAFVLVQPFTDKVYIIDELDRRLHPLITKNFISMFFKLKSSKMQLIITTHETRMATTDVFRLDEINLVDHDDEGTVITRAKDAVKTYNKPFEELYLKDLLLGGVPRIGTSP